MSLKPKAKLHLAPCDFKAAKYAVEHWHYSGCMPAGKTVKFGVWEDEHYIGCVIYSRGANQHLGKMFGARITEVCELTRVALAKHKTPVSRILAISLKLLKQTNPGLRVVVSYADCDENHHGGIYAANGWRYIGKVQTGGGTPKYKIRGRVYHGRSVAAKGWKQNIDWVRQYLDPKAELVYTEGKHKYVMPLDEAMQELLLPMIQPYPKREIST